jgi:hypothetical protein
MKKKLSTKVSILSKGFFALSILGSMSVASAADGFVEDFSAGSLPSHLEAVGGVGSNASLGTTCCGGQVGAPVFENGHVRFSGRDTRGDHSGGLRSYLRTIETDYSSVSFVAEVTVTIPTAYGSPYIGRNIVFFGLGPVLPVGTWGGPGKAAGNAISIETLPTNFAPQFRVANGIGVQNQHNLSCGGNGIHRMRLEWNAQTKTAVTSIDEDYLGGVFSADCTLDPIGASLQTNAIGRIYIGGDWDAIFDDLKVTIAHISPFKSHAAISGGAINIAASSTVNGDLAAQAAVVIGANTVVNHEIYAGAAVTTGALSTVENIFTGAATGIGAGATAGEIYAGAATVVGAGGEVGDIHAGAAITLGAGATAGSQDAATASAGSDGSIQILSDMDTIMGLIGNTQSELGSLVPTVVLPMATTMGGYIPLEPGVHHGDAVSIAASSTVAFDASNNSDPNNTEHVWVINLSEALTVGAGTHFEVTGLTVGHTATIIWNIGAALNLGAGTSFRGTAFVDGAVNAATSSVSCGHLYATGAISIGSIGVDSLGDPAICENADTVFTYLEKLD